MDLASGMRSVAGAGDVTNSVIVAGDDVTVELRIDGDDALLSNLQRGSTEGRLRALAPEGVPPASAEHLDRATESAAVRSGIGAGRVFELGGAREIGKTLVVRSALQDGAGMRDGSVYVLVRGKAYSDVLQELHDAFYESDPPAVVGRQRIRRDLAGRAALVVLDSIDLEADELRELATVLPGCSIVLAGRDRGLGEGSGLRLGGLATPDALKLVEQELQRPLNASEVAAAQQVCALLDGHPYELRQAAAGVRDEERTFDELAQALAESPRSELAKLLVDGLSSEETAIISRLAALRGASVGGEHLAAIAGTDLRTTLGALQEARLIASDGPRYRIAGTLHDHGVVDGGEVARVTAYFARWARGARERPARLLAEAPALLELLRRAGDEGRDADVIALGRACDAGFAWARRWQTWGAVLDAVLVSAERSGDASARAWALHQAGTVAYCLGDSGYAREALQEALEAREMLGESDPAAATRHNLEFIAEPPSGDAGGREDGLGILSVLGIGGPSLAIVGLIAAVVVVIGVLGGVVALALSGGDESSGSADASGTRSTAITQTQTTAVERFTLDVTVAGEGSVSLGDRTCRERCTYDLQDGTEAALVARPGEGSTFIGWSDPCTTRPRCSVTISGQRLLIASFISDDPLPADCDEIVDPGCSEDLQPPPDCDEIVDPGCSEDLQPPSDCDEIVDPGCSEDLEPLPPQATPRSITPPVVVPPPATAPPPASTTPRGQGAN